MADNAKPAPETAPAKKRKRGRPIGSGARIQISTATIEALAAVGCTPAEIAQELTQLGTKVSARTIQRRLEGEPEYKAAYEKGFAHACVLLRKRMFLQAHMMNGAGVAQAQYLAHNLMGMSGDRGPMVSNKVEIFNQVVGQTARERIEARINRLADRIGSRMLELNAIEHKPESSSSSPDDIPKPAGGPSAPIIDVTPPPQNDVKPPIVETPAPGNDSPPPQNASANRPSLGDIFRAIKEAAPA
jgi:hypothetical protein